MRGTRPVLLMLLAAGFACRSGKSVIEPGAALVNVKCEAGAPMPDELRAWVYDDSGRLWDGVRIPAEGPLVAASPSKLGTILIAPGQILGTLRVHVRGLIGGARALDGVLTIVSLAEGNRIFEIQLAAELPRDADADDVPDLIDDCLGVANIAQGGCPSPGVPDAAIAPDVAADGGDDLSPSAEDVRVLLDIPQDVRSIADRGPDNASESDVPVVAADVRPDLNVAPDLVPDLAEAGGADVAADHGRDVSVEVRTVGDGGADAVKDAATDLPGAGSDASCGEGGQCGKSQGAMCAANSECASGACADGVCCTNDCAGTCRSCNQPSANGVCQGYASGSDPELECASGSTCNGVGACGPVPPPNLPNGQLCAAPGQCQSGFCKDGVCCNTACTDVCFACGTGTCLAVKRTDDVPECTYTMTCNPKGNCVAR